MLMVYIIAYEGIPDMERRRLLENAKLSLEETQAITNLSILGVKLSSATSKREGGRYSHWGSYAIEAKKNKEAYDLSRYVPLVKRILEVIEEKAHFRMRSIVSFREPYSLTSKIHQRNQQPLSKTQNQLYILVKGTKTHWLQQILSFLFHYGLQELIGYMKRKKLINQSSMTTGI